MSSPWNEYLKTYGIRAKFPITLTGSSANCKSTILTTENGKSHFVKCQVDKSADDIMCDNINNIFLLECLLSKEKYATKLIDSFQVPIKENKKVSYELLKDYTRPFEYRDANIQEAIFGLEVAHLPPKEIDSIQFKKAIFNLFNILFALGIKYSFSHNDAHLKNLMIVKNEQDKSSWWDIVLIDYGRCVFDIQQMKTYWISDERKDKSKCDSWTRSMNTINRYMQNLGRQAEESSGTPDYTMKYKDMIRDSWLQPNVSNFLLDISTITLNVLTRIKDNGEIFSIKGRDGSGLLSLRCFSEYFEIQEFVFVANNLRLPSDSLSRHIYELIKNTNSHEPNIYTIGIYIFALYLDENLKQNNIYRRSINQDSTFWIVEFNHNDMREYMYHSFQYFKTIQQHVDFQTSQYDVLKEYLIACKTPLVEKQPERPEKYRRGGTTPTLTMIGKRIPLGPRKKLKNSEIESNKSKLFSKFKSWIDANDVNAYKSLYSKINFQKYYIISEKVKQCIHLMNHSSDEQSKVLIEIASSMMNVCESNGCVEENVNQAIEQHLIDFKSIVDTISHTTGIDQHVLLHLETPRRK